MADRIPHRPAQGLTARESSPSDISEPEKKSKKKVTEESTKSGKKPRVTQVERSTEDHSDESTSTATTEKTQSGMRGKIKKTWRNVQEKMVGPSKRAVQPKTLTPTLANPSGAASPTKQQIQAWQDNGRALIQNAAKLRHDFVASRKIMETSSSSGLVEPTKDFSELSSCVGLGFPFYSLLWTEENILALKAFGTKSFSENESASKKQQSFLSNDGEVGDLKKYNLHKPVKLLAGGISTERFAEVLKALQEIPSHCPVILDLSSSGIGPAELNQLVDVMEKCPMIYHLDLRKNMLCEGDEPSPALIRLFENLGPISHLYLEQTGFNDNTAVGIQDVLERNRCLRYLDLQSNRLTENGVITIIDAVVPVVNEACSPDDFVLSKVKLENNPYTRSERVNHAFHNAVARCEVWDKDGDSGIRLMPFDLSGIEPPQSFLQGFIWNMMISKMTVYNEEDFQRL
jgi:hypothetical protein